KEIVEVKNFKLPVSSALKKKKKVGVLISGSGTNLQALIDYTQDPNNCSSAEIVLVLSNVAGVEGLNRASRAGIPTRVIIFFLIFVRFVIYRTDIYLLDFQICIISTRYINPQKPVF
ncbi:hypothetical protein AVEN_172109-1, partial [Araneus ventricosus]